MTREEKFKILNHYCSNPEKPCPEFVISPESDLDKAIAIIDENTKCDPVNHPAHYTDGKIEVIDFITDKKLGFCLGNVVKYVSRAGKKDPAKTVEDLKKARFYLDHYIKVLEEASE